MNQYSALLLSATVFSLSWIQARAELPLEFDSTTVRRIQTESASVFHDPGSGFLTLTFRYTEGEPEVRIPVREMGWPSDWSEYRAVQYTFSTTSQETVSIGFSDGEETRFFVTEPLPGIRIYGVIPFDAFVQTRTMTPLRPLGYKVWPERLFTFEKVEEIVFRMRYPSQDSQFTLYSLSLSEDVPQDDILDKKPLIDRYGQWIPENWPDKAHSDEQLRRLWEEEGKPAALTYPFCPLGGDLSRTFEATGFFRTERADGRWFLVDPHGHPFYSAGMDLVGYDPGSFATDVTRREFLFEELPPPGPAWLTPAAVSFYIRNIIQRYGEGWQEAWEKRIVERLKSWGFNTIGNWSDRELAVKSGMPYVLPLSGWTTEKQFPFPYDFPDVFSAEFERNCEAAAREQVAPLKDDPRLIGWFLGNEPRWARSFGALQSWPEMVLSDPEPSATKDKLIELMAEDPDAKDDFLYVCAEKYFRTVTEAVRKQDPNHLILGIRFAERPHERWAELSSIFDVFSMNIYSADFRPDPEMVARYSQVSGKPVIIGEFTAGTPGRGLQGLFYNVHKVKNHAERGKAYRYYVEHSAADPHIIGAHWFQLVDDLPTGRPSDEERMNYGFINVIDLPYPDLVEAARITHQRVYELMFGLTEPYAEVPEYN